MLKYSLNCGIILEVAEQAKGGIKLVSIDLTFIIGKSPIATQSTANRISNEQRTIEERLESD